MNVYVGGGVIIFILKILDSAEEGEGYIYAKLLERPYDLAAPLFLILHMNGRKAMCPVAKQNIISSSQ